jgi:vacuolar-type H+-ATPase subunit H
MTTFKRILIGLGILIVLLIGAAAAIPVLFKDQLLAKAKTIINEQVNAEVEFSDVSLSLFRHFPDISFGMDDLTVNGIDTFRGVTLAKARRLDLTLDLLSVIRSAEPIRLQAIDLHEPVLDVRVLPNGQANYDIAKPTGASPGETPSGGGDFRLQLDRYTIHNGQLSYLDAPMKLDLLVEGLQHTGRGDLTLTVYDLDTKTTIERIDLDYANIPYLDRATADLDAILSIDQGQQKYTLKDNDLTVNALSLVGNGFVQLKQDDIIMDLDINAPSNDFKEVLSLVPGAYLEGYEDVKASGQFKLNAQIKGIYNAAKEQIPSFAAQLEVDGASVQYPDLPLGIDQIAANAKINSPSSDLDRLTVDIPTFNLRIGDNPLRGRFSLATPMSNPTVDTELKGVLDLAQLSKAFPMEGMEQLSGRINADIAANTSMNEIDGGNYEAVDMQGALSVQDIRVKTGPYPLVSVDAASLDFTPRFVAVENLDMTLGESDIKANGRVDNILAYFSPEKTMTGQLQVRSSYFNANEWVPSGSGGTGGTAESEGTGGTGGTAESEGIFDRFDFALDAEVDRIEYENYVLENTVARGSFSPSRLAVTNAATRIGDSDFRASGSVDNVFGYLFDGETLGGDMVIRSNKLDLNPFMTAYQGTPEPQATPATNTGESYGVLLIPDNIGMRIRAEVGELIYTNMNLRNLSGVLEVADKAVALRDLTAQAFGGQMALDGMYDTSDPDEPSYSVAYAMEQMQFQEAFTTLNTFQAMAPIGRFIEGLFTTRLALEGTLGENMTPKLNTLNAKGYLETIDGVLKSYTPLQKLGSTLNIEELKSNLRLENTKNWLEITNGMVEVKPFDVNLADIPMTIGGTHGLNRQMAYEIKAAIPRTKLENNAIGSATSEGLRKLQAEASKLGLPFEQSETVNVMIALTGSLTDPKVKVNLLGLDGDESAGGFVAGATEQLKEEAKDQIDAGKEQVKEEAGKILDSLQTRAREEAGKLADQAKEEASKAVDSLLQEQAKKVLDQTGTKTEVDNLKKELEKFNPFKKKKTPEPAKKEDPKKEESKTETKPDTTKKKKNNG